MPLFVVIPPLPIENPVTPAPEFKIKFPLPILKFKPLTLPLVDHAESTVAVTAVVVPFSVTVAPLVAGTPPDQLAELLQVPFVVAVQVWAEAKLRLPKSAAASNAPSGDFREVK